MKNLFIIAVILLFIHSDVCGQKVKPVPTSVRKTFKQKFPNIKKVIWDNENLQVWEAEFRKNGNEYSVLFDVKGIWIKTEHEIDRKEIPSNIKATLSKEFAGYKIIESLFSETANAKVYKIGLKKDGEKLKVTLDIGGKILKRENGNGIEEDNKDDESNSSPEIN